VSSLAALAVAHPGGPAALITVLARSDPGAGTTGDLGGSAGGSRAGPST
jgi:hypothetical protein